MISKPDPALDGLTPLTVERVDWPGGMSYEMTCYLTDTLPPIAPIGSVRAIVLRGDDVLVVRDPTSTHVWPGGRVEVGESLEEALHRELGEETGWRVGPPRLIGFRRLYHLQPKPEGWPYDYPQFYQVVYAARAETYDASLREIDGHEISAEFRPRAELSGLPLSEAERIFIAAAVNAPP